MTPEDSSIYEDKPRGIEEEESVISWFSPRLTLKRILYEDKAKLLLSATVIATVAALFCIILFISYSSIDAIREIGMWDFLTGGRWAPRFDMYGAFPMIAGTIMVTAGAIAFSFPLGLGIAIYINDVASPRMRGILKPVCEVFAGIPSVVYGLIGITVLMPLLTGMFPDKIPYGSSWLAASFMLGIMALPTIISVSQDALAAVPRSYREASMAMGATKWETTRKVVMHSAISGISAAAILGVGRAMGETMVVLMVSGNAAALPEPLWNMGSMISTLTSKIASGVPEADSGGIEMSALFLLGLILLVMVLFVNITARRIVRRTKMKMGEKEKTNMEKRFDRLVSPLTNSLGKYKEKMIQAVFCMMAFTSVFMISYLFLDTQGGIVAGALAVGALFISKKLSKILGPKYVQKFIFSLLGVAVIVTIIGLVALIGIIVMKGAPAINLGFILDSPSNMGLGGGIRPAIAGTLELMAGTSLIVFPLGICSGVYLAEYAKDTRFIRMARQAVDALSGTPSIIFGLFGMSLFAIALGWGFSLIGGCITLALMALPTIIRTTEEAVRAVPNELREASAAMGASKWHTTARVVIPAAMGGVLTGFLLSIIRAIGEAAPIMFTAVVVLKSTVSSSLLDPIMALPYHIYHMAAEVPGGTQNAYGSAIVLMAIVLSLFTIVSVIRHRQNKKMSGW
ncbi:MAG: phosphate ABC transporter permease PstA [Methanomassiliicoccaceae archaeon]|nr:phosphate ABC transporter permease PstA [Methanomassiliicoccaceae archaeon]